MRATAGYFVAGIVIGAMLSLLVLFAWPLLYAGHPWPGYRASTDGPHEFNASPVARTHVFAVFLITGAIIGWYAPSGRHVVSAWMGLSAALLVSFLMRPAAWSSNLAPLAVLLYPAQAALFLIAGMTVRGSASLLRRTTG